MPAVIPDRVYAEERSQDTGLDENIVRGLVPNNQGRRGF